MQAESEARLRFEMLLADVCAQFVNVAPGDIDSKITNAQRAICESLKVDHSTVWQVSDNSDMPIMTHVYRDPTLKPLPSRPNVRDYFPWTYPKLLKKEIVCVPNTGSLPREAATDKESWEGYGVHSSLVIPLSVGGGPMIGILAFDNMDKREWPEPLQRRLEILARAFAQAFDRKNADRKLRESEDRRTTDEEKLREYERVVENAEEMIAVVDREYRYLIANHQFLKVRKMTQEQVVGHVVKDVLKEGVFDAVVKPSLDECFQGKVVRYEMKYTYPELGERDLLVSYFPIEGANGIDRAACILQDITERKHLEAALRGTTQKLIESQEKERTRIARELHDNINQRLALLSVELEHLMDDPSEVQNRLQELRKQMTELSNDVQTLSHDLHSSKLEYLGVVAGMKSWCKDFGERQGMQIDCTFDVPSTLPQDIGLCLFRVLQEALHNAAKHSGVKRIEVQLHEESGEIHLIVRDLGKGFDIEAARQGRGLGLTSMQERVRLLNGSIEVQSKPMNGTTIHVRVPLDLGHAAQATAGQ